MTDFLVRTADELRSARSHAGADLCRQAIAAVLARRAAVRQQPERPLSLSEVIHLRAQERAAGERRLRGEWSR
jgi:hypothetical protein